MYVTYGLLDDIQNKELLHENHRFTRALQEEMEGDVNIRDLVSFFYCALSFVFFIFYRLFIISTVISLFAI